jgi:hypothetical protein
VSPQVRSLPLLTSFSLLARMHLSKIS